MPREGKTFEEIFLTKIKKKKSVISRHLKDVISIELLRGVVRNSC